MFISLISPHLKECAIWRLETLLLLQLPKKTLITIEDKSLVESYIKMGKGASLGAKIVPLIIFGQSNSFAAPGSGIWM